MAQSLWCPRCWERVLMRFAQIPPTVAPPSGLALRYGLAALFRNGRLDGTLASQIQELIPSERVFTFGCGRAALAEAIGVARRVTGRDRVVIPAYTSFSVAAAVAAAGAVADLCDVDESTLALDRAALRRCVGNRTAAVVLGNLYGFPEPTSDFEWVSRSGALLIDDAAQALGACEGGRPAGGRGHLGVLSFGRGKCISTGQGGALLVNDPELESAVHSCDGSRRARGLGVWVLATALRAAAHPVLFGVLSRLPGARVGESRYDPEFKISPAARVVDGLAVDLAEAVTRLTALRAQIAASWMASLSGIEGLRFASASSGARPAYLRMPVFVDEAARRMNAVRRLRQVGFGYVGSYPCALAGIPEFRPFLGSGAETPHADRIARTVIALPCHVAVRERDVKRAAHALAAELGWASRGARREW